MTEIKITKKPNLLTKKRVAHIVERAQDYRDYLDGKKTYTDEQIEKAVIRLASETGYIQKKPKTKVLWLGDLLSGEKTLDLKPEETAEWCHPLTATFFSNWSYQLNSRLRATGYNIPRPDEYGQPELTDRQKTLWEPARKMMTYFNGFNRTSRIDRLVNSRGLISTRVRRIVGSTRNPTVDEYGWQRYFLPTQFYITARNAVTSLNHTRLYYLYDQFVDMRTSGARLIEAARTVSTGLYSIIPMWNRLILVEAPKVLADERGLMHNEAGPAVSFPKLGIELYGLHGIEMPKHLVTTPAEKLSATIVPTITNVDVRREVVRKIGLERLFEELEVQELDRQGDYQLVTLHIGGRDLPYLKMDNPSIDAKHFEGVPIGTTTVQAALAWRNGTEQVPAKLT